MHSEFLNQYEKLATRRPPCVTPERDDTFATPQTRLLLRAVEQSPAAIVITNAKGLIEYVNPRFEEITGYTAAEVQGKNLRLLKSGELTAEFYRDLWDTISHGHEWQGEFHNRKKNGELYWDQTSISPVRDETGAITHYIGIKEEITARKLAAQQVLLAAALVENTADVCVLKDRDLRLLAINRAGARLVGNCEPRDLIGQSSIEVFSRGAGADLARSYGEAEILAQRLPPGERVEREETVVYADGSRHTHLTRYFPVFNRDGVLIATGNISTDISARKTAERELVEAKETAEAASRAKSVFLTNISHELRTPLNAINGVTATLAGDPAIPSEHRAAIALVQQSGEALLDIIEEVLLFSSLQAGKSRLDLRPIDIRDVVTRALRIVSVNAAQKEIILTSWIDPAVPETIRGDAQRLQQVLLNLLGNAVKFTAKGRRVHLGVRARPTGEDRCRLECYVVDNGVGIAPSALRRLFQPFSQADDSITRKFGGTGLGLAISKSLLELMGGQITVRSREGYGSAFRIVIDCEVLARATTAEVAPSLAPVEPPRIGRIGDTFPLRILVADDIHTNREAARMIFRHLGYKVTTAENGVEVLAALEKGPFDLIVLDVQMPVMDGLSAAREIRRRAVAGVPRPKLVALTANAQLSDRQQCLDAGMDEFLSKPVLPGQIEGCIRRLFGDGTSAPNAPAPGVLDISDLPWVDVVHHSAMMQGVDPKTKWELLAELHHTFRADIAAAMPKLEIACREHAVRSALELVHGLKGGALMIGWTRAANRCAAVVHDLRAGTFAAWDTLAPELSEFFSQSSRVMSDLIRAGTIGHADQAMTSRAPSP